MSDLRDDLCIECGALPCFCVYCRRVDCPCTCTLFVGMKATVAGRRAA